MAPANTSNRDSFEVKATSQSVKGGRKEQETAALGQVKDTDTKHSYLCSNPLYSRSGGEAGG